MRINHFVHNYFNPPPQTPIVNYEPSMTQQHFTDECDVNQILKKFIQTGILDTIGPGVYADISDLGDYRESLEMIRNADEMFAGLPSRIRARFENDPAQYLAFVQDPKNLDEGIELGIFTKNTTILNNNDSQTPREQKTEE